MNNLCKKLMLGGSMAAMVAAISANAADAQEAAPQTEAVTVSASRIQIQGYQAPTPVTVIGVETLNRDAKVDIGDAIRELPSVGISDSPGNGSHSGNASQGDAGIDTINLRGLGVVRTLVLFDGQRVVTSNPNSSAAAGHWRRRPFDNPHQHHRARGCGDRRRFGRLGLRRRWPAWSTW